MLPDVSLPPTDAVPDPLAEKEGVVAADVTPEFRFSEHCHVVFEVDIEIEEGCEIANGAVLADLVL